MSDHETPDPVDKAYLEAQAALADDAARAERRARVLTAVAAEASPVAPKRTMAFGRGGWLVAAGIAGLGIFLGLQMNREISVKQITPPAPPPVLSASPQAAPAAVPQAPEAAVAPPPTAAGARSVPLPQPAETPAPVTAPPPAPQAVAESFTPPPPPPPARPPPPRPAPPPALARAPAASVATEGRVAEAARAARDSMAKPGADPAADLRAAAAAGRIGEVMPLLSSGVSVDAPDEAGETALMKAVRANQPAAAALLRRNGASLDRENRAGRSARDMAAALGSVEMDRALGLGSP
jgi:hypothetical protein